MICWSGKGRIADYIDGRLRDNERARFGMHLRDCERCTCEVDSLGSVRSTLRDLKEPQAPSGLKTNLRVLASRERQTLLETRGSRLLKAWNWWKFRFDQLMRPITIPATGGVLSSLLLFAALAFTIGTTTRVAAYEVPVFYTDHSDANLVPVELRSSVVLTLSLDGSGRIRDYAVRGGSESFVGNAAQLQYNNISLPEFPSVFAIAQPISRDISISFQPIVFRP